MCFSADASFGAATALVPMGSYCIYRAYRVHPRYLPFATIPLVFGIQQLSEAFVWQRLLHEPPSPAAWPVAIFLFFAIAWWPFWSAFCSAWVARGTIWGRFFVGMTLLNLSWFIWGFLPIFNDPGNSLTASVVRHSIHYNYSDQTLLSVGSRYMNTVLYVFCTCCPILLLSVRVFLAPVLLALASLSISAITHVYAFTSVWCFFAAVISAYFVIFFHDLKPPRHGVVLGADGRSPIPH